MKEVHVNYYGQSGAKVTGYTKLNKGDKITIKFYDGGKKSATLTVNNDYSTQGGAGGRGIGIYKNTETTPFGAAGRRSRCD